MSEPLKASDGSLFVQLSPNSAPEYIGCADVDALPDPRGAITLLRCRDGNGDFQTVGETQDAPDVVSTTVTAWVYPTADVLDRLADKRCRANLFLLLKDCGKRGQFGNWVRADLLHHARLTNITDANYVMREAGDPATRALELTGWGVIHLRNKVSIKRQVISETTNLNALAMDVDAICAGDCGESQEVCQLGFLGGDAPSGSPTATADIWHTANAGSLWSNTVGGAAHPFVAGEDVVAAAQFALDRSTKRWLVSRGVVGGQVLKVAYSDDSGDTWTRVSVAAVVGEGVANAKALFALDREHIWLGTTEGNVYFSEDGGLTWTLQSGAATADGASSLNAVRFLDVDNGYAVGDAGAIIKTDDGGETWSAIDDPSGGDDIISLAVFSPFRILVGTDADGLYHTLNSGTDWSAATFTGQSTTGTVQVLQNVGDSVVWMAHNPLTGQGYILRSIDGGNSWERYETPTNSGFTDLAICDANNGFAIGNANGGTGFVAKISA